MHRSQPLSQYPEFIILDHQTSREFRVENWKLARDGSNQAIKAQHWSWLDMIIPVLLASSWSLITTSRPLALVAAVATALYVYAKCTKILWESVIAIPSLGLQIETHRGLPSMPLLVSRYFIPMASLQDVVINEGLRGWDVRYYLTAVATAPGDTPHLFVAYENILPYFPVLLEVYRGVHEILFE